MAMPSARTRSSNSARVRSEVEQASDILYRLAVQG